MAARELADAIADGIAAPEPVTSEYYFGLVMNTGRSVHRRAARKLFESMLVLSGREIPLEIFLAMSNSREEGEKMHHAFNAANAFRDAR